METYTVIILILAGLLFCAIAGYLWMKRQDETPIPVRNCHLPKPAGTGYYQPYQHESVPCSGICYYECEKNTAYRIRTYLSWQPDYHRNDRAFPNSPELPMTVPCIPGTAMREKEHLTYVTVLFPVTWEILTADPGRTGPGHT